MNVTTGTLILNIRFCAATRQLTYAVFCRVILAILSGRLKMQDWKITGQFSNLHFAFIMDMLQYPVPYAGNVNVYMLGG